MYIDSNVSVSHLVCCQQNIHINSFFLLRYPLDNIVKDYSFFVTNPLLGIVYIAMPQVIHIK